jgi:plastocyanin
MTKSLAALLACLALGLVAAGCGGGNDNSSNNGGGGGGANTSKQKQPSSGGTAAKTSTVTMKNIQFNPKAVSVPAGGTVKWTNDDSVGHDVTAASFKSGSPGGMTPGDSFSHTFKKAGTYKYVCTIHKASGMTGTVIVK